MSLGQALIARGFSKLVPELLDEQMRLMAEVADFEGRFCLELGARDGRHSEAALRLGARMSTAVDGRSDNIPAPAERNPNILYMVFDARRLNFDHGYDIVMCYGLLYHVEDPGDLVASMCRWTKEWLFISTHVADSDPDEFEGYRGKWEGEGTADVDALAPGRSLWLSADELRRAIDDNGFTVERWEEYSISDRPAVWLACRPKNQKS